MEIVRIYYNATNDVLRQDRISIRVLPPRNIIGSDETRTDQTLYMRVSGQKIVSTLVASGSSLAGISAGGTRVVDNIEVVGEFDDYDVSGPDFNIEWASKTLGNDQVVRYDMSNLPKIGDTI